MHSCKSVDVALAIEALKLLPAPLPIHYDSKWMRCVFYIHVPL